MANKYPKEKAESVVAGYKEMIKTQRDLIWSNFNDMDLDNADVKKEFEEHVKTMMKICDKMLEEIGAFSFE